MSDAIPFFRAWLSDPFRVTSVVPSSRALAKAIASELNAASAPVIELGPGTGVFMKEIFARDVPPQRTVLVESGHEFANLLCLRFPEARVLRTDAADLKNIDILDAEKAGAVISGLPLLSMSPRKVISILDGAFWHLREGGAFYQFTYGPRCPVSRRILDRLDHKAVRIKSVFANIPPARVYRITRRAPLMAGRRKTNTFAAGICTIPADGTKLSRDVEF